MRWQRKLLRYVESDSQCLRRRPAPRSTPHRPDRALGQLGRPGRSTIGPEGWVERGGAGQVGVNSGQQVKRTVGK